MSLTRAELEQFRDAAVHDLVGNVTRLAFVGVNPSLLSAATGMHFAHPGNRFYPALRQAGILDAGALTPEDAARALIRRGVAITNLVNRATVRADELSEVELLLGRDRLERFVADHRPRVVAAAGITAYRVAFGQKNAKPGRQPVGIGDAELWVVPNPSGLNAHETIASLAAAYREAAVAAGVV